MSASNKSPETRGIFSIALLHSVVLAVIAIGSIYEWQKGGEPITSSIYMLFYAHVAFSLASGRFKGATATTWVLLLIVFGFMQAMTLIGHLIPFGQLSAQIQQEPSIGQYVSNFYENISFMGVSGAATGMLVFLLFLGLNVAARFSLSDSGEGMTERLLGIVAVLMVAIIAATTLFTGVEAGQISDVGNPPAMVLEWYLLPFMSALRAIPDNNAGAIALVAMLVAPILAIFITQARSGSTRWFVRLLLLLCFFGFWGLGYYGGQAASEQVLFRTQILLGCYFAYFLIAPFLTSRNIQSS